MLMPRAEGLFSAHRRPRVPDCAKLGRGERSRRWPVGLPRLLGAEWIRRSRFLAKQANMHSSIPWLRSTALCSAWLLAACGEEAAVVNTLDATLIGPGEPGEAY